MQLDEAAAVIATMLEDEGVSPQIIAAITFKLDEILSDLWDEAQRTQPNRGDE